MRRQIQAYLFPGAAERDEGFRQEVQKASQIALLVIGSIQIAVALFMLAAHLIGSVHSSLESFRLRQGALIIGLGAISCALSRVRAIRPYARWIGIVISFATAAVLLWASLLVMSRTSNPDDFIPGQITMVMLVAVTIIPLRPMQTLGLGAAITALYAVSTLAAQSRLNVGAGPDENHVLFIVMLTLLCTAITALLYHQRRANYDLRESQARMLLAENAASMARLTAALSHELNNPMGALLSGVDTMLLLTSKQATCGHEEQGRLVLLQADVRRSIKESAERLRRLVSRIQRFTNLDQAEVQNANLNELLADVAAIVEPQLHNGAKIELDLQPVPPVVCKPQQISAVFSNLLANAIRAVDGDGRIVIATRSRERDVEIEIRDNGRGLDPKDLKGIFDPTFRVAGTRVAAANWSMFSSRQIIREHGGEIKIDSGQGLGTIVRVTLPATMNSAAGA